MRRPALPSVFALLLVLSACGGAKVESEPGPAYTIEVHNPRSEPMIVFYTDGKGTRLLGTVSAGGAQRFVITSPTSTNIVVTAHDEAQTRTITRNVTLQAGTVVEVRLGD